MAALAFTRNLDAKPALNLIAIVTDDQAAWTLGCYGGREIRTPNLDRLATEGVRFANAFVHTPVCSPSRGTYMTGLFGTSIRVPLMIRYPGVGKPGKVVEEWVTNADTFATVLGLLGIEKPSVMPARIRDYSAAVRGEKLPPEEFPRELFGQYDLINNPTKRHMRMIRTDRWKLVLHLNATAQNELYDLAADPGEPTNVFGQPGTTETVGELTKRLRRHMAAINDPRLNEVH